MSDDRAEELKRNILSPSQWIRILYMVFYAIACWVLTIVLSVIILVQMIISLITGSDNENLRTVGKKVSDYFHEMLDYLVYASNDKPWPFSDEGNRETGNDAASGTDSDEKSDVKSEVKSEEVNIESTSPVADDTGSDQDDEFADISFTDDADDQEQEPNDPADTNDNSSEAIDEEDDKETR